ncbi:MAG: capsule assembly Wzi family protein [Calditrichia bacterium]
MKRRTTGIILFLLFFGGFAAAQGAQPTLKFLYLQDGWYDYWDYLINSGRAVPHFVLNQPYAKSTADSLSGESAVEKFYQEYLDHLFPQKAVSGQLTLTGRLKYRNDHLMNRSRAEGGLHLVFPHITLANRTALDQQYKYDPDYAGDLSESNHWLYGRVNEAYMQLHFKGFGLFLGRMKRNWGAPESYSLLLSAYPYSYDHLLFSWENSFLKLSVIAARLEDGPAIEQLGSRSDSLVYHPLARKFLAGHRLDLHLRDNLQLGLTEMTTYGGPDRDFELAFLNPMTFYYGLQRNDRQLNNGKWALDLLYKPVRRISVYGQFMIDDIIVNNDPGVDDRGRYPDRLAGFFSLRSGDLLLPGLNTDLSYVRIWNHTYQSRWTWENYHYRGLGLGYPGVALEEIKLKLGYWGFFPLFLQQEVIYGRYGTAGLDDVFLLQKEAFPVRPVQHNLALLSTFRWHFHPAAQAFLKLQYFREPDHYLNRLNEGSDFTVQVGFTAVLSGGFSNIDIE